MIRDYRSGTTEKQLAEAYGVALSTVKRQFKQHGVKTRRTERKLTAEQVDEATRLYRSGQSLAGVGTELDVSSGTVRRELLKAGVKLRPRPGS
jgi:transposase